jgi:hypothetical protein
VGGQLPEQLNFTWKRKILSLVFEMLSISPFNLITKFYFLEFKNSDLDPKLLNTRLPSQLLIQLSQLKSPQSQKVEK